MNNRFNKNLLWNHHQSSISKNLVSIFQNIRSNCHNKSTFVEASKHSNCPDIANCWFGLSDAAMEQCSLSFTSTSIAPGQRKNARQSNLRNGRTALPVIRVSQRTSHQRKVAAMAIKFAKFLIFQPRFGKADLRITV